MSENPARCPRCGSDFHCGFSDPSAPCACKTVALEAATLAALRQRYSGCLCVACLREIQRGDSRADAPNA